MTVATVDVTDTQIFTGLRTLILAVLADGTEVVQAYSNQVPEPRGADFVVMSPLFRERLSTNVDEDDDIIFPNPDGTRTYAGWHRMHYSADFSIQLDVHGPTSAANAQVLATLGMNDWANQELRRADNIMQLLYATSARQVPFINAESQYEWRWIVEWHVQANAKVSVFQDFADHANVGLINVDVKFPP